MQRRILFGAFFVIFSALLISQLLISANDYLLNNNNDLLQARKVKKDPIFIDGDADFVRQANRNRWPGSGTLGDPYIIEHDVEIPYTKGKKSSIPPAAISISHTTVHFIIRSSTLTNYNGGVDGIVLWNVINGEISDNFIFNFVNCILLLDSDKNVISNNDLQGYSEVTSVSPASLGIRSKIQGFISRGIFLDPSNHNIITDNRISGFTGTGVELLNSSNNLIDGNIIDNNAGENAVFLAGSDANTIINNDICDFNTIS
ncbi:MAG: NosD domain-containing protein, partial [Promethearchaeota archaeon]